MIPVTSKNVKNVRDLIRTVKKILPRVDSTREALKELRGGIREFYRSTK